MDTLLIHYTPSDPQHARWVFVDEKGQCKSQPARGSLTDLAPLAKGRKATALIDASCINIEKVKVPSNNRQRQIQAVPYALEDTLAANIEDTHFALAKKQSDDNIPVISINRELLEQLIDDFRQAGIFVDTLAADALALPRDENSWSVLLDEDHALIKTGALDACHCDRNNLEIMLAALLKQADQQPEALRFYHAGDDDFSPEVFETIELAIDSQSYERDALAVYAQGLADSKQLHILQGDYAPRREGAAFLKPWKAVASLAAVWLALQLVYAGIESRQLGIRNQQLQAQIENEFKRANPGARKFNNMQKRMERRLNELRGGGGSEDQQAFLQLLAHASPALSSNKKVAITAMVYRNKHVDMELQADSLQSLESVKAQLSAIKGIKTVLSTSIEKNKVTGRLRLEKQG